MNAPVRALVVDDSAFMRKILTDLLGSDPGITVIGTARNGLDALAKCRELKPDVITLDIEMPELDGLSCLERLMVEQPLPVVMVSSLTQAGADATLRALDLGAVDFLAKPSGAISLDMATVGEELRAKVKVAAKARLRRTRPELAIAEALAAVTAIAAASPVATPVAPPPVVSRPVHGAQIVVIGCSTGGPGALHEVVPRLPANLGVPVLIVQHMPPGFTRSLANRLNELSPLNVREAATGDTYGPGDVLIAPGGYHMLVGPDGRIILDSGPPLHGVRPAVDITLRSVITLYGAKTVGVVLTGMGYDGARAMLELQKAGGQTIVEHQSTCVVYGMPRAVVELGAAGVIAPLPEIPGRIIEAVRY